MLFGKLQQGVQENQQILTVARLRADAEEVLHEEGGGVGAPGQREREARALAGTVEPIRAALEANHGLEPPRR